MVATVMAGIVSLAGCSSDARHQAGADEPVGPERNAEIRVAITGPLAADPALLNPTHTLDVLAADLLYDGLTAYDGASGAATPALASSWDTTDGATWRFHLDPTRTFSDGSTITAEIVVASLERVRAMRDSSLGGARLDGISAISSDGNDVVVALPAPNYELPALLADPSYGVVAGVATAPTMASQTVVSGRFRVRSGGADGATLVPVDGADVSIDGVEFVRFPDDVVALDALRRGDVDIAPLTDGQSAPSGTTEVSASAATLVLEIGTNGVWSDAALHDAMLGTIDRPAVASAVAGSIVEAKGIVPGGVFEPGACASACAPDTGAAGVLTTSGAAASPVDLMVPPGEHGTAAGGEVARQLTAAGLPTEVRPADSAAVQATLSAGSLELALFVVVGLALTPDPYLAATLSSVGSENLSGYASAEFDTALAAARAEPDVAKRRAAYVALEASAMAGAPVIPLVQVGERFAVSKRVTGVTPIAGVLFDAATVRTSAG